jgi:hypothetical protein
MKGAGSFACPLAYFTLCGEVDEGMKQQVPTWLAAVIIVVVIAIVAGVYMIVGRPKTMQAPENFQPGKTAAPMRPQGAPGPMGGPGMGGTMTPAPRTAAPTPPPAGAQ